MLVHIFNQQTDLPLDENQVRNLVKKVLEQERQTCDEVSLYFVSIDEISQLHQKFFNDPSPTDCISFPLDQDEESDSYQILGEVFVCPAMAIEYAQANHLDPYEETTLYVIHGLLHLMGYDDIEESEIKQMRHAEAKHLKQIKKLNLLLKFL